MHIKTLLAFIPSPFFCKSCLILIGISYSAQTFTQTSIEYYWEFGDGQFSTEKDPEHQYEQPGIYTSRLSIFRDQILVDSQEKTIDLIRPYIESISIEHDTDELNVSLTAQEQFLEALQLDYIWLIEPTSTELAGQNVSHSFKDPGNYTVSLNAYFENNLVYTTEENLIVEKNINEIEEPASDSTTPERGASGGGAFGWWAILLILLNTTPYVINILLTFNWQKKENREKKENRGQAPIH